MARQPDYCFAPVVAHTCVQSSARTDIVKQVTFAFQFFFPPNIDFRNWILL